MLELTNAVNPVDGREVIVCTRFETCNCSHCQRIIVRSTVGLSTNYDSEFSCRICGPICVRCARIMHANGNRCSDFKARVDHCRKTGQSLTDPFFRERKYFPVTGA